MSALPAGARGARLPALPKSRLGFRFNANRTDRPLGFATNRPYSAFACKSPGARRKEGGVIAAGIVIMEIGNLGKESN
jgi:hypothetical protein